MPTTMNATGLRFREMRIVERVVRIVVASTLTVIFTVWWIHLFESQPSEVRTVQIPQGCPSHPLDQACLRALKLAFSGIDGHWSLWLVWVFWALIAVVWLAASVLILWAPRRANNSVSIKLDEASVDDPLTGYAKSTVSS